MSDPEPTITDSPPPLRSVHTTSVPQILSDLASSVLVTTYQAGKLVVLRNDDGVLNTHFRDFVRPMGLSVDGGRLALGTAVEVLEFHNVPAVCSRLDARGSDDDAEDSSAYHLSSTDDESAEEGTGDSPSPRQLQPKHDACFLPRRSHTTGNVQIHEMAWVGEELWFVNTAFSCLSTRSDSDSFEPRWRPTFIDKLTPGDACHLNGLAVQDGRPAFVTALGETNSPGGWRENKRNGGILIDVDSNEIVTRGLSMPHSPRWHRGKLWLLESGDGSLGFVDLRSGRYESIVQLPGFTRGLSFIGPLAFVGLSQVRESAVFSGIPLVERQEERICGIWIVDIESGQTIGYVKFEDAVQEIFAVELLAGIRYPDIINHDMKFIGRSFVLSDQALSLVPAELRSTR